MDIHFCFFFTIFVELIFFLERQRCALWVKKLCEPLSSTTERYIDMIYVVCIVSYVFKSIFWIKIKIRERDIFPSLLILFFISVNLINIKFLLLFHFSSKLFVIFRKNRNQYSKLLLRMLKRGNLEGPFTSQPEPGPLKSLPSYMVQKIIASLLIANNFTFS